MKNQLRNIQLRTVRSIAFLATLFCALTLPALAQVSSATITGAVKDQTGAIIPHVVVLATETTTGVKTPATTNDAGEYSLPLLKPGTYNITVETSGFRRYEQRGLALSAGDHPTIDIPLAIGDTTQTIEVNTMQVLLGTEDANEGQVVPSQLLEDIPLSGRTPMSVAQFTVGVVATTNPVGTRPFDNSAVAAFSVGGLPNKNSEILMDGSPDNASDNAPAYELPLDAAREVSIKVFESDATYGHSGGAVANQITKSGANQFHGSLDEFNQNSGFNAYNYFQKRTPTFKPSVSRQNQYGGTIGGPVWIPRLFNGRDKMFFFFAYEGFRDSGTGGSNYTVPTAAERTGDFSALLSQGSIRSTDVECKSGTTTIYAAPYNSQAIFDPASGKINQACLALGFTVYDRTPFANNNITSGALPLSPIALKALAFFPAPNTPPQNALGQGNYYSTAETGDRYDNELGRLDLSLGARQKLYLTGRHNQRAQYNNQVFGASNPALGDFLFRLNYGGSVGDVITFTPSLLAEVRLNYTRYSQPSYTNGDGFNPTSLGLPALASAHALFPRFFFNNGGATNLGATTQTPGTAPFNSYDIFTDVIKTVRLHTLKAGVDLRRFQKGNFTFGNSSGLYNFNGDFTGAYGGDTTTSGASDVAAFLLGLPSSAQYDFNSHAVANQTYMGLFFQDDWRATPNLTLNAGIRVDKDFSPYEREGTAVSGFDTTDVNPYNTAVSAAYAAHPSATLPAANFKLLGGLTFNSPGNPKISNFLSTVMVSPRVGFAFKPPMLKDSVIRGGFGIFVIPIFPFNNTIQQQGFSASTQAPIVSYAPPTSATGPGTLSNPFPNGLATPTGSSLGLATFNGQAVNFLDPNIKNGYAERWNLGFQHQFPGAWLVDVFYEGSTGRRLPINENLNFVKAQYETTASNTALSASVANPFVGLVPNGGTLNTSATVPLTTLLQTYPQFGSNAVTEYNVPAGSSIFHALDIRVDHRFGKGLSITANYQWSKLLEAVSFLNLNDSHLEYRISQYDHPNHAVVAVSYKLPFGRGRQFGGKIPRYLDLPFGGLNVASSWFYQQGAPLSFGNLTPTGQPLNYNPRQATEYTGVAGAYGTTYPSFNINAFNNNLSSTSTTIPQQGNGGIAAYNTQPSNNIRTFQSQFANLRNDALNEWDASILKNFNFTEHAYLQMRLEAFNVNNRPAFSGPNLSPTSGSFGQITGTQNSNRFLQVGARVVF